jgi:adenylyltransferase/sulfurtransferase
VFRRVLIAGIGALGSELLKNIALLGCERVFIADADLLEEKNRARSILMRNGTAGESKVTHAIARLTALFPHTEWCGSAVEIADVPPEEFECAEILFSCVDTDLARTEIAALAARYKLDVCDAGLGGTSLRVGRVSWFPFGDNSACFACLLSARRRAQLLSQWDSTVHACWVGAETEAPAWTSTPAMASIVAGLQMEIAHAKTGREKDSFSLQLNLDRDPMVSTVRHTRSAACPLHGQTDGAVFPVCTLAECAACGAEFAPGRRVAWVRRRGVCPLCGRGAPIVRKTVCEERLESAV